MNTGIIIQARTGSARFPGKILQPVYNNQTVLEYLLQKLLSYIPFSQIVIATTSLDADNILINIADKHQIKVFQGDENNVLKRMTDSADKFGFDSVIRVCSDNPFLSPESIIELIGSAGNYDYVSYATIDNVPSIKTHYGFFAEYVKLTALKIALKESKTLSDFEHVTQYLYSNIEIFGVKFLPMPYNLDNYNFMRCTLDDIEDLKNLVFIAEGLKGDTQIDKIIKFVLDNPPIRASMECQIKKYTK